MTAIALIISATFLEGWTSIYVLVIAGVIYIISQIFFWWNRWKHQKNACNTTNYHGLSGIYYQMHGKYINYITQFITNFSNSAQCRELVNHG
jgi:predicted membrane channel-forming protein YqfA (hemolysin III family)